MFLLFKTDQKPFDNTGGFPPQFFGLEELGIAWVSSPKMR